MKRDILLILFFSVLFFLPLISAVEFTMNDNFQQGETILAKVSGNFITPITKENILFYRGHVQIPIQYDVANIGGDYYIYALTTGKNPEDDYSISLEDIKYMKGAEISSDNIRRNFTITNETAVFSVNPGFIVASESFYLEVQNLLENGTTINVKTESNSSGTRDIFVSPENVKQTSISLRSGEIKQIIFNLGTGESTFQNIELNSENFSYAIPVYISSSSGTTSQQEGLSFEPSDFITSLSANSTSTRTFFLYNNGANEIKNISLSLSDSLASFVKISNNQIENLSAGSHIPIELSFFSSAESDIEGNLKAAADNFSASSFISLQFLSNFTASNETETATSKTCAELNGTVCTETQKCDSDPIYAKDNVCCLTTCQPIKKSSSGIIIAIVILSLITILLLWFYFAKYRKAKKPVDLLKIAKGKTELDHHI